MYFVLCKYNAPHLLLYRLVLRDFVEIWKLASLSFTRTFDSETPVLKGHLPVEMEIVSRDEHILVFVKITNCYVLD